MFVIVTIAKGFSVMQKVAIFSFRLTCPKYPFKAGVVGIFYQKLVIFPNFNIFAISFLFFTEDS